MKNKSLKDILIPAVSLLVIAAVCTALLAYTNILTKDKIAAISEENANAAKKAVFAEAADFSDEKKVTVDGTEYTYFEALDKDAGILGYVVPVTTKSYGGDLSCVVGISAKDESVTGVEITEINDTAGLGMKAKNDDFLSQYLGKTTGITVNKNAPAGNEIRAITGATISSKAVTGAVNQAFAVADAVKAGVNHG